MACRGFLFAGVAALAVCAATCGGRQSVVVVTVDGALAGVRQIGVRFVNGTSVSNRNYPTAPSATDIPLPTSLSATFGTGHTGAMVVQVAALDATGRRLGGGTAQGTIVPGGELDLTVLLAGCAGDACGPVDAGSLVDVLTACPPGSDGNVCGPGDSCNNPWTCMAGVCTAHPLADGTLCGAAPDICHDAPVCTAGACGAPPPKPDGTVCGSAPDVCHDAPVCSSGVCAVPAPMPDGTVCGSAPDVCHDAPVCAGGACGAPAPKPDGTVCAAAPSVCYHAGVCSGGVCGAPTYANGVVCNPASNACHTNGTCSNGTCGSQGTRSDGYQWGSNYVDRCCGGSPVQINTGSNCGACGISCGGYSCVSYGGQEYECGCSASSACWSKCCSTSAGAPYVCVPSNCTTGACISCPGGATCSTGSPHNYCHY